MHQTTTSVEEERHHVHLSLPPLPVLLLLRHSVTVDQKVVTLALIHYGSLQFNHYPWAPYKDQLALVKTAWKRAKMVFSSSSAQLGPYTSLIMEQGSHIATQMRVAAREVAIHFYTGVGPASVVAHRADVALANDVNFIHRTMTADPKVCSLVSFRRDNAF
ncbi:hypothetical protein FRC00_006537 [Tulasnella sp. 408]|nr:hypothetical protein FRC00_006537 [Tulasnella sp. 408]